MKNLVKTKDAQIGVPVAVPEGAKGGDVLALGTDGLTAVAITDRATQELINLGMGAVGVKAGMATVELVGCSLVTRQMMPAVEAFAALYIDATTKELVTTKTGNIKVGYALDTLAAPGKGRLAHV